ncbi:MAG: porin [Planktomarina sp.]|nr:porin [Planktomarina sp.]
MKRILLTSTALTMTAGIAAADVSVSGSFKLGFNDTAANGTTAPVAAGSVLNADGTITTTAAVAASADWRTSKNHGVYNDAGITFAMSSTLDNGMAAGITVDMNGGDTTNNAADSYTLSLASDALSVSFGTVEYSARSNWASAGDMATDGWFNQNASGGNVLKADASVGGLAISASAQVTTGAKAAPNPVSISVGGSLGGASYVIASEGSMMGVSTTSSLGGSTVTVGYSTDGTDTSTGVKIAYPAGAITTTASYVVESAAATVDAWNVSAAYSAGGTAVTFSTDEASVNKLEGSTTIGAATVSAGLADNFDDMYLAVSNSLGGGAAIMASYAVDGGTPAADEVGAGDWQEGLTVELTFAF